jgi:hypothetical protein
LHYIVPVVVVVINVVVIIIMNAIIVIKLTASPHVCSHLAIQRMCLGDVVMNEYLWTGEGVSENWTCLAPLGRVGVIWMPLTLSLSL